MYSRMLIERWISPSASLTVFPSSRLSRRARSSFSLSRMAWARKRMDPRTGAGVSRQAGKAARAASAARRVSSAVESGMWPRTSRVSAGFRLGVLRVDSEATHSPPTKLR
jgi:hypothetical protein